MTYVIRFKEIRRQALMNDKPFLRWSSKYQGDCHQLDE